MSWRISYWNKQGNIVVKGGFLSESDAMAQGQQDLNEGLVDTKGNLGILVDEYQTMEMIDADDEGW
jgi:hypothetical protein